MPHKNYADRKRWLQEKMKDPEYAAHVRARQRAYRQKNLDTIQKSEQKSYARRTEAKAAQCKRWRQQNPDKVREYALRHRNKDRLTHSMATSIWGSLKGKKNGRHWEDLVDYTAAELRAHLESLFQPGMSWDTYGKFGWHVDHIRPRASFNITSVECTDFKECWALSNLQPLWYYDNLKKSNTWDSDKSEAAP